MSSSEENLDQQRRIEKYKLNEILPKKGLIFHQIDEFRSVLSPPDLLPLDSITLDNIDQKNEENYFQNGSKNRNTSSDIGSSSSSRNSSHPHNSDMKDYKDLELELMKYFKDVFSET